MSDLDYEQNLLRGILQGLASEAIASSLKSKIVLFLCKLITNMTIKISYIPRPQAFSHILYSREDKGHGDKAKISW